MAVEFEVETPEDFERMITNKDIRISKALVKTVLKNLKSKKNHHHALSVVCTGEGDIYDVTIDKRDFQYTLETTLPTFEREELYEDCSKIAIAIKYLKKQKK
tara:strand:+ start:1723 stop:2028 length:306 start_codon:yes stop_codon:yes gene_type:complete